MDVVMHMVVRSGIASEERLVFVESDLVAPLCQAQGGSQAGQPTACHGNFDGTGFGRHSHLLRRGLGQIPIVRAAPYRPMVFRASDSPSRAQNQWTFV